MKLITLNLWGGRLADKYDDFFQKHHDVDAWIFQEVYNSEKEEISVAKAGYKPDFSLNETLSKYLDQHKNHFCQVFQGIYGISTFLKSDIEIISSGETLVARGTWHGGEYDGQTDHNRKIQWFEIKYGEKNLLFINAHLTHRPVGKADSPKRILQSENLIRFMNMFDCPKILAGDFNLLPDTESIKMIEASGMRNLIKEHGVTSTRTELYKKQWRFADYIFVSPEIKVKDFKVLPDIVSDHSPLYLDFDI